MTTDEQLDAAISAWFEETAPRQLPERVLDATFDRTRRSGQQVGWRALMGRVPMPRAVLGVGVALVLAVVAFGLNVDADRLTPAATLPTSPEAWSRVAIAAPSGTGRITSVAVGPNRLLAVAEEERGGQLFVSTDGLDWTLVPPDRYPSLAAAGGGVSAVAVGTDRGFLLLVGAEISYSTTIRPTLTPSVWASEDGLNWQRLATAADDPDLAAGRMHAAVAAGPGLVGVGSDNNAWYSTDGSDWSLAEVPPPPAEPFQREGYPAPTVLMRGVAVAGDRLVAWGLAYADNAADSRIGVPVMWASRDGRSWESVPDFDRSVDAAAGGPVGFVAAARRDPFTGDLVRAWLSPDGLAWDQVGDDAFTTAKAERPTSVEITSVAATSAGYVAVGGEDDCQLVSCPSAGVVIWTSADGRAWSRLPGDDLLKVTEPRDPAHTDGARAETVVAWGTRFVVGGAYDGSPAIWISGSEEGENGANPDPDR